MYTPALRWDNLQETHGPPPPSHSTLISADLCGSVFHRSNHPVGKTPGTICRKPTARRRPAIAHR
ncbi:hypothetical protein [Oligosphaera ethanolica]|uniref:Uncharacterized protein n=1 Tax=Oligosphaera ethanolica TaxID=760260 RepID=A0AAE3VD49_9BACT|nr:hypothetical protein [Oligosphaera ethanolica]MDQ0288322.1 hypothetical protein [Oligosphaera ethanolica]